MSYTALDELGRPGHERDSGTRSTEEQTIRNQRHLRFVLLPLATGMLLSACASSAPTVAPSPTARPALPTGADAEWDLVVIGDSSLWLPP